MLRRTASRIPSIAKGMHILFKSICRWLSGFWFPLDMGFRSGNLPCLAWCHMASVVCGSGITYLHMVSV